MNQLLYQTWHFPILIRDHPRLSAVKFAFPALSSTASVPLCFKLLGLDLIRVIRAHPW
jgi:hypothetical protein